VDPLPERVRLVAAPGGLRGVELAVLGWRTEDGEVALCCRLIDGSAGTIPARWTDLPPCAVDEPPLGCWGRRRRGGCWPSGSRVCGRVVR
jgi:hypothetical protein